MTANPAGRRPIRRCSWRCGCSPPSRASARAARAGSPHRARSRLSLVIMRAVPINTHGLADFRVAHAEVLDSLLSTSLAAFMAEGLVTVDEIIVDGTKVMASAGKSSFKRATKLAETEAAAKARVAQLKAESLPPAPIGGGRRSRGQLETLRWRRVHARRVISRSASPRPRPRSKRLKKRRKSAPYAAPGRWRKRKNRAPRSPIRMPAACALPNRAIRSGYNVQFAATPDHGFITAVQTTKGANRPWSCPPDA